MRTFGPSWADLFLCAAVELLLQILQKLVSEAEAYTGAKVVGAVITIPAYFDSRQRSATKRAAEIAGIKQPRFINEPTAAALAYGVNWATSQRRIVLVYDFGGGTFDVSVLAVTNGDFDVLAIEGDSDLGGSDFDNRLVDWCVHQFKQHHNQDPTSSEKAMTRLKVACETAKRRLANNVEER